VEEVDYVASEGSSSPSSSSSSSCIFPSSVIPSITVEVVDHAISEEIATCGTTTNVEAEFDTEDDPPLMYGYDLLCCDSM
jgi:hypothetical protein